MTKVNCMDWGTTVRPLLAASYGNVSTSDLLKLARTIGNCRKELMNHNPDHKPFYSSLVALSIHFFGASITTVSRRQLSTLTAACRVLAEYLIKKMDIYNDNCPVTQNQFILLSKSLCNGQGCLQRSDVITLAARLKSSELPAHIRSTIAEKSDEDTQASPKSPRQRNVSTSRPDPLGSVFDCLVSPLAEFQSTTGKVKTEDERTTEKDVESESADVRDVKELYIAENVHSLIRFDAFSLLLDVCLKSRILEGFYHGGALVDFMKGRLKLPNIENEKECGAIEGSYTSLSSELETLKIVLDLPICDVLSTDGLSKLADVAFSCVLAAAFSVVVRFRESEEEETDEEFKQQQNLDTVAFDILQNCLSKVYKKCLTIVRNATVAESMACENFQAVGTWLLATIVQQLFDLSPLPSVVLIEFAEQLLSTAGPFLRAVMSDTSLKSERLNELTINTVATCVQKFSFIGRHVSLIPLILRLVQMNVIQVTASKRLSETDNTQTEKSDNAQIEKSAGGDLLDLDPLGNTCLVDTQTPPAHVVNNQSTESTDQEPLLGSWLEQLLSNVPQFVDAAVKKQASRQVSRRRSTLSETFSGGCLKESIPNNRKLIAFTVGAIKCLNGNLLGGSCPSDLLLHSINQTLRPHFCEIIANIIHCLDNYESDFITDSTLSEIGGEIVKLVHNLLVNDHLNETAKNELIVQLVGHDLQHGDSWALKLSPRVLGVLGQMLFVRLYRENSDLGKSDFEVVVCRIWERFFGQLKSFVRKGLDPTLEPSEQPDDVNVEHVQLLLLLFHALQLMHKKAVLLDLCRNLIEIVDDNLVGISYCRLSPHLARFLLIFEYMLRNFYEPPSELLDHVRNNIFPLQSLQTENQSLLRTPVISSYGSKMFYSCIELEDRYRSRTTVLGDRSAKTLHPSFYELCKNLWTEAEGYPPKLDGLALNFLLGFEKYDQLYCSIVQLLAITTLSAQKDVKRPSVLECASVQYTRTLVWRLLGQLPVASGYLPVANVDPLTFDEVSVIHWLRLSLKLKQPEYLSWLKETLMKQSLTEQAASDCLAAATGNPCSDLFLLKLCQVFLDKKLNDMEEESDKINRLDIINISIVVAHIRRILDKDYKLGMSSGESEGNIIALNADQKSLMYSLFKMLNKIHQLARTLLICETEIQDNGHGVPNDILERLLQAFCPATVLIGPLEACRVRESLRSCSPYGLVAAFEMWSSTVLRDYPDIRITKSLIEMDDENPIEKHLSLIHAAHMNGLSVMWELAHFESLRYTLEATEQLVCDVIIDSRIMENHFEVNEVEDLLLPHLFSAVLKPDTCDRINNVLTSYLTSFDFKNERCSELQNKYFISAAFAILSSSYVQDETNYVRIFTEKLSNNVKRSSTWPAWATYLSSYPGKELIRNLLNAYSKGNKFPLGSLCWIEFMSAVLEPSLDENDSADLAVIHQTILVPLLSNRKLVLDWASTLDQKWRQAQDYQERKQISQLINNFLKRLTFYLTFKSKESWTFDGVSLVLEGILSGLLSQMPTDTPDFGNYILPTSDRWYNCTMTPISTNVLPDGDEFRTSNCIPSGFDAGFESMITFAVKLADLHGGHGHLSLIKYVKEWLKECKRRLSNPEVLNKFDGIGGPVNDLRILADVDTTITIMAYLNALIAALGDGSQSKVVQEGAPFDSDLSFIDVGEEIQWTANDDAAPAEEEESGLEDSGDEENLDSRLCTFIVTQKEFMNQHWYHCHTCGMVDGEGVCTICAKVCHKDHDLSYSKFGSFFCDCGAKQNDFCLALIKRTRVGKSADKSTSRQTSSSAAISAFKVDGSRPALKFGFSTPILNAPVDLKGRSFRLGEFTRDFNISNKNISAENREKLKNELCQAKESIICQDVLDILANILPVITKGTEQRSPSVALERQRKAFSSLHSADHAISFDFGRTLFTHQHSTQGAAFEAAKLNLTGEQGQQIRQMVQTHALKRTPLALLSIPEKNRQFLAVGHEKCKVTIVQSSIVLRQAESNKKKLSLARSSFETLPFVVLSLSAGEDCLAACGLKECQVMVINSSGVITDKITLQPELDNNNPIIKAEWCPAVRGLLAFVTGDFVNVYDLTKNSRTPRYQFLLPVGRIRDVTFACWETSDHTLKICLIFISSLGHIYLQQLGSDCLFEDGTPFYVTNAIRVDHPEIQETQGSVAEGGISVYYSHSLQLLFVGYQDGKNIAVPLSEQKESVTNIVMIPPPKKSNESTPGKEQSLYRWSELAGHPGLVIGFTLNSLIPVALYFGPNALHVQELTANSKPKGLDFIPVFYENIKGLNKVSILVLCDDGSLQFFDASDSNPPDYWLTPDPTLLGHASIPPVRILKKKGIKTNSVSGGGPPVFSVDFFESSQQLQEIEFGGPDLQSRYDSLQLKNRLNTSNLYITCSKSDGFELLVRNRDLGFAVCGIRIEIGKQAVERSPSFIEVFGRKREVRITRSRWFDIPFTREESYAASRNFTIKFGPCLDPNSTVVAVDTVKVYGKTKEAFGWTDDFEETVRERINFPGAPKIAWAASVDDSAPDDPTRAYVYPRYSALSQNLRRPLLPELLLMAAFETLDNYFTVFNNGNDKPKSAMDLAMSLLCTCVHPAPVQKAKSLLRRLFDTKEHYYAHKDRFLLSYVWTSLPKASANRDPDLLTRLLVITRDVANKRPNNLVQFTNELIETTLTDSTLSTTSGADQSGSQNTSSCKSVESFLDAVVRIFWDILNENPQWASVAPAGKAVASNLPILVRSLVEVLQAFCQGDNENVHVAAKTYAQLLLCPNRDVGHWTKQTLSWIFRPKSRPQRNIPLPSPPRCSTPGIPGSSSLMMEQLISSSAEPSSEIFAAPEPVDDQVALPEAPSEEEFIDEEAAHYHLLPHGAQLEALLANAEGLEHMLGGDDLVGDGDDEAAMVELAIALSLQENGQHVPPAENPPLPDAPVVVDPAQLSDTTNSGLSDEEGSTAATDGSTLRTSPTVDERTAAEVVGSGAPSESGGSASGRSSTYGDGSEAAVSAETKSSGFSIKPAEQPTEDSSLLSESGENAKSCALQTKLLTALLAHFPVEQSGIGCVAYMQTLLLLTSDLNGSDESHKVVMISLLKTIMKGLDLNTQVDDNLLCTSTEAISTRSPAGELNLLKLRMLSVLLSKAKGKEKGPLTQAEEFLATQTAQVLIEAGSVEYCHRVLSLLLNYWKNASVEKKDAKQKLLTEKLLGPCPDLSPFFLRQYVREHVHDIFECYTQLLTEMALRLPYQIRKVSDGWSSLPQLNFDNDWARLLCEFVSCQEAPFVRRQARKLLLVIAGSKEDYRFLRDKYTVETHMAHIRYLCSLSPGQTVDVNAINRPITLSYIHLNDMMERLKTLSDLANSRSTNWQKICLKWDVSDSALLPFLLRLSCVVSDVISQVLLDLIHNALCPATKTAKKSSSSKHRARTSVSSTDSDSKQKLTGTVIKALTSQLLTISTRNTLIGFLKRFLLDCNVSDRRWQVHSLVCRLFENGSPEQQRYVLDILWKELWPETSRHGEKAMHLVDLLSYNLVKLCSGTELKSICQQILVEYNRELKFLTCHPNANLYCALSSYLECEDGYFLERNPCLVCNNPEVAMVNIKLSSVRLDSRSTTTSQIVKMVANHEISKVSIKFSELKRTKMVKQLNLFYSNKTVSSAVELKNKPELWSVAKRVTLTSGQTDVKIEFPVPIVACNLMLEFAEFYEAQKSGSELLHCPRCSASVPANPGVCGNCGENVFQCHKCRSINYDEKDPFLCNSCGFSKYAKFEVSFVGRQIASVEPIENEEDRKKTVSYIDSLLEKADTSRKQLRFYRVQVEASLSGIYGQTSLPPVETEFDSNLNANQPSSGLVITVSGSSLPSVAINRGIQEIAVRYWKDCKVAFEELSRTIQRILANRNELLQYDAKQGCKIPSAFSTANFYQSSDQCYGCITARTLHCVQLLRALASTADIRRVLIGDENLLQNLIDSIRCGPKKYETSVQAFLAELSTGSAEMTNFLCDVIHSKVKEVLESQVSWPILGGLVQCELRMLRASFHVRDQFWEIRLKCAFDLFVGSLRSKNRASAEHITLPCMELIRSLLIPECLKLEPTTVGAGSSTPRVNLKNWLSPLSGPLFEQWQAVKFDTQLSQTDRTTFLEKKFGYRWLTNNRNRKMRCLVSVPDRKWLENGLFCPSSAYTRAAAAAVFRQISSSSVQRRLLVLDLLTKHLEKLGDYGERSNEFMALYKILIVEKEWKCYLSLQKLLPHLAQLITKEVELLAAAEDMSFGTDLTRGYAIKILADLLQDLLSVDTIRKQWKADLLGPVLNGYLGLRILVVQRTKMIDDAQAKLLTLLEELTTGTETETKEFMAVCIETVRKYPIDDMLTPVFIFERLCSIIYPEEKEVGEFLINIEKDPAQEDFLQGRMMGNPYSSKDAGMGPLMKDIKNKVCRDCELVALLEDDTGMELLVNNKIVSLDLPVVEVYKKLWQPQRNGEAILIMYRMRGLLGDATEEFIETLDKKKDEKINEEEVYHLAKVLGTNAGLEAMLERLQSVNNLAQGRALLTVLLKLFGYCVKIEENRIRLNSLNSISVLLSSLEIVWLLKAEDRSLYPLAEELLTMLDVLLEQASKLERDKFADFAKTCGTADQVQWMLGLIDIPLTQIQVVKEKLIKVIPNLTLGSEARIQALINHFKPFLDYNKYDYEGQSRQVTNELESFCVIAKGIQASLYGNELKDRLLEAEFVKDAAEYLLMHHPPLFKVTIDSPEWKEFLTRPALKYVLKILAGLCMNHSKTQMLIANDCIPIIHRLEQISTEEWLGSLAENLMEALRENPEVAKKIEEVREETKQKKKQMAKAMRDKQLMQIGMTVDSKGQVRVAMPKHLKDAAASDLKEETGLICSICQEGYKSQPNKVLGIYTYSRRVDAEPFETRSRRQPAYTTVTHFNVVHFDCHQSAVKSHRGREEWESAALHNANTKCNGLLPLWGPEVPESNFANCLARFNSDLQNQTGCGDVIFSSTIHDLKLLLMRFSENRSFSSDTGGGGKESNIQLIPCLALLSLYVLNTTKLYQTEQRRLTTFLDAKVTDWVASSYAVEGPLFCSTLALLLLPKEAWEEKKIVILRRLVVLAQARHLSQSATGGKLSDTNTKEYSVYKPYLLFFALLDGCYNFILKNLSETSGANWPQALQDFIRCHDMTVFDKSRELLKYFEHEIQLCGSVAEFFDVSGLLEVVPEPDEFMKQTLCL